MKLIQNTAHSFVNLNVPQASKTSYWHDIQPSLDLSDPATGYMYRNCTEQGWTELLPPYDEACVFNQDDEPGLEVEGSSGLVFVCVDEGTIAFDM